MTAHDADGGVAAVAVEELVQGRQHAVIVKAAGKQFVGGRVLHARGLVVVVHDAVVAGLVGLLPARVKSIIQLLGAIERLGGDAIGHLVHVVDDFLELVQSGVGNHKAMALSKRFTAKVGQKWRFSKQCAARIVWCATFIGKRLVEISSKMVVISCLLSIFATIS